MFAYFDIYLIVVPVRFGGHGHKITIQPSTYTWSEFKDKLHFFVLLGVIPLTLITSYVNIFIGPAELTEIPDGYTPQRHEYFKVTFAQHNLVKSNFIFFFVASNQSIYSKMFTRRCYFSRNTSVKAQQ